VHVGGPLVPVLQDLFGLWRGESQTAPVRTDIPLRSVRCRARSRPQAPPATSPSSWTRSAGGTSSPSCVGDGKRARWKPTPDPHLAGSGYRHGKTHTNRRGSTSARQRTDSGHVFTRFLNGIAPCMRAALTPIRATESTP
jgi:hypothetical protein